MDKRYEMLKSFDFNYQGLECRLEFNLEKKYKNGKPIIRILKRKSEKIAFPFATLSADLEGLDLKEDEFVLNNNPLYEELINHLINEKKYFEETGKKVCGEHGETPICKIIC